MGFCFGGAIVNMMAVRIPDLGAAVPFYGRQPSAADTAKIKAPLLLHYASLDERVNAGWPAFEAALKANGVKYQAYMYPGRQPRLPQRHDAALRRGRCQAGVVTHDRVPERESEIEPVGARSVPARPRNGN